MSNQKDAKESKTSGGVCKTKANAAACAVLNSKQASNSKKMPSSANAPQANTPEPDVPKSASENWGDDTSDGSGGRVQNPPVPNRARTEM